MKILISFLIVSGAFLIISGMLFSIEDTILGCLISCLGAAAITAGVIVADKKHIYD